MPKPIKVNQKTEEPDESWVVPGEYIYTSKGLFSISKLQAAEKKKKRDESKLLKQEQLWLTENDLVAYPFEAKNLLMLKDNCSYFDSCVKQIAKDVIGQGWRLEVIDGKKENNKEKERILKFIDESGQDRDETFEQTIERSIIDWGVIGWWAWDLSRGQKGKDKDLVDGMWHVPAQTLYIHKDYDKYAQVRGDRKMWFKRFGIEEDINCETGLTEGAEGEKIANEIIYYRNYYPQSDYYGAPNILSSVGAVMGLIGVRDYNLAFFENYGIPAALIILEGRWSKGSAKQISDFIDVELKGSDNSHKTLCIHPSKDSKLTIEKLSVEVKEGSFKLYQKSLRDEILSSYKVPVYKINIAEVGSLGGNVAVELNKNYAQSVVRPLEKTVERLVTNKIIHQGLQCESYKFELNTIDTRDLDAETDRDVKLFGIGARTPNQVLARMGVKPYEDGNRYYVSSAFIEVGEEPIEKGAALLEAVKMVLKGKPKLAMQVMKIAKREAKK